MRIANTPSVVSFSFTKQDKWKLEQALGKEGGYRFTVIGKDTFKVIGRDPHFKSRYGDGFYVLGRANRKRREKLWRVSIHNLSRVLLGDFYSSTEGTMTLKKDKHGPYMELVVSADKIPFKHRAENKNKKKTTEQKIQSIPIVQGNDGPITLDHLFAAHD